MIVFQVLTKHWGELNVHLSIHWSKFLLHKLKFKNLKINLRKRQYLLLSFSKTDFIFDIMCKTQLEQWAEVTDFLTKFHIHFNVISLIFKSILYSIWINTVVHLRQIFMENLGAQETGKKMSLLLPSTLFSFPPIPSLHSWFWIIIVRIRKQSKYRIYLVWNHVNLGSISIKCL